MENINSPEISDLKLLVKNYSPYLIEIRKRIIFTLVFFALSSIAGFVFYEKIIRFLIDILSLRGLNIVFTSPFQFVNLALSCGLASGLVLVFPLLTYQILSFFKPALKAKEFQLVVKFIPFSIILFISGFILGFLIMKWQIAISLHSSISLGIGNILDISHLLNIVLLTSVLMGIGFQFPLILLILLRIGIIKREFLSKRRLWVYLGSFVFAILLPADSIIADLLLTLPFVAMFELTLILDRIFDKPKIVSL